MAPVLELIAGSYEQIVFGYKVTTDGEEWTVKQDFSHHAHTASISAVAASERFVVTGSKDERIQLYDMKKKTEHGALLHHDGSITCLEFFGSSHLLSGGEDGLICVWGAKKWECLKTIKAHQGHVTSLSVHPSGKLALSVGADKTLRTWNLLTGRSAFIKNIKHTAEMVRWSPDGDKYAVVHQEAVDVYDLATASVTATITNPKRVSCVKFLSDNILAIAGDDETLRLCDVATATLLCEFKAHSTRVKAVDCIHMDDYCVIVTASNDGFLKLWKMKLKELESPTLLLEVNTTARLTCLAVWKPSSAPQVAEQSEEATTSRELVAQLSKLKRKVRICTEEVIMVDESKRKRRRKRTKKKKEENKTA